jgi:exodeoxyribonuclease V beta subunit
MQPFDVLNRHCPVFGSHFLEASAGTGKTFAIEHLVVRLLIESEHPLLIEQILVVTFTRAATRELKQRIRSNLHNALLQLQQGSIRWDYLLAIQETGPEAIKASIRRLEDALASFESAQIFTIHRFCYQALSECAFEAGIGFQLNDPDEAEHLGVVEQGIEEYLLHQIDRTSVSAGQVAQLWRHVQKKPEKLRSRLATLVMQDHEIDGLGRFQEAFEKWNRALSGLQELELESLIADWQQLSSNYKLMGNARFPHQQHHLGQLLASRCSTAREFDQLLKEKELFLDRMRPDNLKLRPKTLPSLHYPGLLEKLRDTLIPILDQARDPLQTLLRLARDCRCEIKSRLERAEVFSPDDLLHQMQSHLDDPHFLAKIQSRYRAAIVDEFQDTDPIQWNIFQRLFVGKMRSLCLVGDPKQSIYAFRNADLYTYLKAASALGEEHRRFLDTNYRSTSDLVTALNRLFASKRLQGWMALPQLGMSLDVHPVKAGKTTSSSEEIGAVHFFALEADRSKQGSRRPSDRLEQTALFPYILQEMLRTKREKPWNQFAILVKDRYQAQRIWDFLKTYQIPALIRKSAPLHESDAFILLQELLEAICFPSDLSRLKKLLGGPLIGWNEEKIRGSFEKPSLCAAKEKILLLQESLREGFSPFFHAFLTSIWNETLTVEESLLSQRKLDLYTDLLQLGEIIADKSWRQQSTHWLSLLEELRTSSSDEEVLKKRINSDEDAVQILTIHMSKGLEFETVFALGLASAPPSQDAVLVQVEGKSRLIPFKSEDPHCHAFLQEADAEKLRQFYVALTRAKSRVYVPLIFDSPSQLSSPIELYFSAAALPSWNYASVDTFLKEIKEGASITLSPIALSPLIAPPVEKKFPLDRLPGHLAPFPSQPVLSYSALAKKGESDLSLEVPLSDMPTALNMPLGTQTGLVFHAIMEGLFLKGLHFFPDRNALSCLIEKHTASTELSRWNTPLLDTVWNLIHLPLDNFSLSEIPPSQIQEEIEFLFPFEQGFMKGFADLVFEWKNKYYLLDWKTNYLGPSLQSYSPPHLLASMGQNDYFLQAKIYAEALKRYVKLFDKRPFSESFGGMFYIFVRGQAVHCVDKFLMIC